MQLANGAVSLRQMFPDAKFLGVADIQVSACSGHWQECDRGDLFVARVDENDDGHDFVDQALARGATHILAERMLAVDCPQCLVEDSGAAYATLCQALAGNPTQSTSTIGVTGSQGKTITAHLIDSILNKSYVHIDSLSYSQHGAWLFCPTDDCLLFYW